MRIKKKRRKHYDVNNYISDYVRYFRNRIAPYRDYTVEKIGTQELTI